MSRGPGRVQLALLRVLDDAGRRPLTTHELVALALGLAPKPGGLVVPSNAEMTTVRRALGTLRRAGQVFDCGRRRSGRRAWASRAGAEQLAAWILQNRGARALARYPDLAPLALGDPAPASPEE